MLLPQLLACMAQAGVLPYPRSCNIAPYQPMHQGMHQGLEQRIASTVTGANMEVAGSMTVMAGMAAIAAGDSRVEQTRSGRDRISSRAPAPNAVV